MANNMCTPKKKVKSSASTTTSPPLSSEIDDEGGILYTISNVSPLIRSPSKTTQQPSTVTWFEFCVQSEADNKRKRVSCFDKKVNNYLLSSDIGRAVNDPNKGVMIKDLIVDPKNENQYKWTDDTTIGSRVIDLPAPFSSTYAPNEDIQKILFHIRPKSIVSVIAKVTNYRSYKSDRSGCVVHKYDLMDSTNDITLASFKKLDLNSDEKGTYQFYDLEVRYYNSEKTVHYIVTSAHLPCKKEIKSSRQPTNQIKIEITKVRSPNASKMCISCHEPVTPDEDQFYECVCGTASTTVKETDGLVIDIKTEENNIITEVHLPTSVFNTVEGGKKELLRKKYVAVINDNVIDSLQVFAETDKESGK